MKLRQSIARITFVFHRQKESVQRKMQIVRKMTEADLEAVAALEKETFSDAWAKQSIYDTFCEKQAFIVVAETDGSISGYCIVYFVLEEGEIARIAVRSFSRRQGVGRQILDQVEKLCREKGILRLMLDVRESNEAARRFYIRHGFKEDGIRKNFYDMPRENAVLMSKEIGNTGITSH